MKFFSADDFEKEIIKTIDDPIFNRWGVSSHGNVFSFYNNKGRRRDVPKVMSPRKGYYFHIILTRHIKGKKHIKPFFIHQMVCRLFHGSPPTESHIVRHLDGNPLNNYYKNLAWGTHLQNSKDIKDHGNEKYRNKNHNAKLNTRAAKAAITLRRKYKWSYAEIGRLFETSYTCIQSLDTRGKLEEFLANESCHSCGKPLKPTGWEVVE